MADKSCYMGAGGYGSGYQGQGTNQGYVREDYANTGASTGVNNNAGGGSNFTPGVTKLRTDQSCYLGPN